MNVIVTGVSRGLGKALFFELKKRNINLIGIVRKLYDVSDYGNNLVEHDFSQDDLMFLDELISKMDNTKDVVYVNNAGSIIPIGQIGCLDTIKIKESIMVNYYTPTLIINKLVEFCCNYGLTLKIVHISSGAAEYPINGWGMYCSSKAAIKMFLNVLELQDKSNVKISIIDPGVMDTEMQELIRNTSSTEFPRINEFRGFKTKGLLNAPSVVAKRIIRECFDE